MLPNFSCLLIQLTLTSKLIAMLKSVFYFALLIHLATLAQKPNVKISYKINPNINEIPLEDLENFWHQFIFLKEGNWVYFNFKTDNHLTYSANQQLIKSYCIQVCNYFLQKGLDTKHAFIHYQNSPLVSIFKEKGKDKPANFITLPLNYLQTFFVKNSEGAICNTKAGNKIVFKPYCFKTGNDTEVKVEVYEMLNKKDMIITGYTAQSGAMFLESNGMYNINASANGTKVDFKANANAEILYHENNFNHKDEASSYLTFYADNNKDNLNWKPDYNERVINKNNQNSPLQNLPNNTSTSTKISRYTEIHYMQLHLKLNYIEPTLDVDCKECVLSANNFLYIVNKYGNLQYNKKNTGMNLKPIVNYNEYVSIFKNSPMDIFIGLNPEQEKEMQQNKNISDEKIAKKLALQKQKDEEERKRNEEEKKLALAEELKNFPVALKINQLGNINCDRFYDVDEKTDVIVKLNEFDFDEIRVYVVFNKIKSVIPGYYREGDMGTIKFSNLPVGEDVVYLAATFKGNEVKLAFISKDIKNKDIVRLEFKTLSQKQYENILNDLIPNT